VFEKLSWQKTAAANANIGQSIDVSRNGGTQEFPTQRVGKVVTVLADEIVVVRTKVYAELGESLLKLSGASVKGSDFDLLAKLGTGGHFGRTIKDTRPTGEGIFRARDFHSGMVQPQTYGVKIVIRWTQVVNVQVDFGAERCASSVGAVAETHDVYYRRLTLRFLKRNKIRTLLPCTPQWMSVFLRSNGLQRAIGVGI
jgi:hypothetical protein